MTKLYCCLVSFLLLSSWANTESFLKQLHVLFRHGERSPTETFPNDPHINYSWSGGWGQLTNKGKLQVYNLGLIFRNTYKSFIPDLYWPGDVYVLSSYADRCKTSAQLFCAGMFPPKGPQIWSNDLLWQPIAVNYLPRSEDNLIVMKSKCDKYDKMFAEVRKSPTIRAIEEQYKYLFDFLKEKTGENVTNIEDVEKIFNTLEIEQQNGLTLPDWVNQTLMVTMRDLAARNLAIYSETQFMKRMKGGMFVKNIIDSMDEMLKEQNGPKLNLYSGHDLTLVHVLRSLNLVNDTSKPSYGASLTFELYSDGEIKLVYRDSWDGISVNMHVCESPCLLEEFKKTLEDILPSNWTQECELDSN